MQMKKLSLFLIVCTLLLVSLSAVSANSDFNSSTDLSLNADDVDSITKLNESISSGHDAVLTKNITANSSEASVFVDGIVVDHNVTIDGNGYCIDANNSMRIFKINNPDVTLNLINITLINGNADMGSAISANGNVIINDCTFNYNNGPSIYFTKDCNISNCVFNNNADVSEIYIAGNAYLDNNYFNVKSNVAPINLIDKGKITSKVYASFDNYDLAKDKLILKDSNFTFVLQFKDDNYNIISVNQYLPVLGLNISEAAFINNGTSSYYTFNANTPGKYVVYTETDALPKLHLNYYRLVVKEVHGDDFYTLDQLIKNTTDGGILDLTQNFTLYDDELSEFEYGIKINKTITINGNGYTLDANKTGKIFSVLANASLSINNCTFINTDCFVYGAIRNQGTLNVSDCNFLNNAAVVAVIRGNAFGGAISNEGNCSVYNSYFLNNTALTGNAIYNKGNCTLVRNTFVNDVDDSEVVNDGELYLENNNFNIKANVAPINLTDKGKITSQAYASFDDYDFVKDKLILKDSNFTFVLQFKDDNYNIISVNQYLPVLGLNISEAAFINNGTSSYYTFNANVPGKYVVYTETDALAKLHLNYYRLVVKEVHGDDFYTLDQLIKNTTDGGILDLTQNFTLYDDEACEFEYGIKINKTITINGNGYTLDANKTGKIFSVLANASLTINNCTFINTYCVISGAIKNQGTLNVSDCNFLNNAAVVAVVRGNAFGGAISNEGNCSVYNSYFLNNTALTGNAIYNNGNCTLIGNTFVNDVDDSEVVCDGGLYLESNSFNIKTNVSAILLDENGFVSSPAFVTIMNNETVSLYYSDNYTIKAYFTDDNNNAIAVLGYTPLSGLGLLGATFTNNGTYSYYNLKAKVLGTYQVSVGGPFINLTCYDGTLIINTTIFSENITLYYKNGSAYSVHVIDRQGNAIVGGIVKINLNGAVYNITTDSNGNAYLPIGLNSGNYEIVSQNPVTSESKSSSITVLSTIVGEDIELYYRNGSSYSVKVMDGQGNAVVGQIVKMNINGVIYNRITDLEGNAYLPIGLNAGTYIITAENPINGEKTSNNVTVLPTLVGEDVAIYHRNGSGYSVKVLDGQGNPAKNVTVRMNVNGVFYNVQTDDNGIATLKIGLNPGNYIITAEYEGFKTSNNISVLPVLTGEDITLYYRDGTNYTVKLVDGQGNPLIGVNVTMNINGVMYNRTTDLSGVANLPIGLLPNTYIITTTYEDHSTSNTITVLARD